MPKRTRAQADSPHPIQQPPQQDLGFFSIPEGIELNILKRFIADICEMDRALVLTNAEWYLNIHEAPMSEELEELARMRLKNR